MTKKDSITGCLLGTAVGDAMGLPCEGLSKQRQRKIYPTIETHHFLFGKGMISDDTEHTCMVAQALIISAGDLDRFMKILAWKLRWWLLGLPAGIGFATLRSILKLWLGFPGSRSGVFSAGNGPAMRSAIIGACYGDHPDKLRELVRVSTRITHTDPKAEFGAVAVALAAHLASKNVENGVLPHVYYQALQTLLGPEARELLELIKKAAESAAADQRTEIFAEGLGFKKGVSGYIYHTIPVVLHAWFRHQQDYRRAIPEIIRCGGDTDTTAAIVGGIIGTGVGRQGIPEEWIRGLWEWPRTVAWMEQLAERLAEVTFNNVKQKAVPLPVYGLLLRNLFFMTVVLLHGFRRLLPPY